MKDAGIVKRAPRVETRFKASLVDDSGNVMSVMVMDISREGCRLESDELLKIGEKVFIEVPKYGRFPAQIRWALGNEAGAVFLEPVFLP